MSKNAPQPGPKGLDAEVMLDEALSLMEAIGPDSFSVRKLATRVGCDPMAVLYHFKSKRGLERAMADRLIAKIRAPAAGQPWRDCMADLARQYRTLALSHPQSFPLLMRFWTAGPADLRIVEVMLEALRSAGVNDSVITKLCFGLYASILGLAMAEVGGLLKPPTPDMVQEIEGLSETAYPNVKAFLGNADQHSHDHAFSAAIEVMLDGIEAAGQRS